MWKTIGVLMVGTAAFGADFGAGLKCYEARDYSCAAKEWQPLAESGIGQAQYNLGLLYERGQGVEKNPARAAQLFEQAAEIGVAQAQFNLAEAYASGEGVEKDTNKAISWFQKSADLGDPNAANHLGELLEEQKDYASALKWYQKAADTGLAVAQFNMGEMYDVGKATGQPDYKTALDWYTKSAKQGDAGALCNIGILYYNGDGVKVDREKAYQYLLLAFQGGDKRANDLLRITGEKIDKKQVARAGQAARDWEAQHPLKPESEDFSAPEPIMSADAKVAPQFKNAGLD